MIQREFYDPEGTKAIRFSHGDFGFVVQPLDPPLRKRSVDVWLDKVIDDEGGPIIYHATSEEQQHSFDSTCRRLRRFLQDNTSNPL